MGRCPTDMCKEIYNSKNVDMFEIDVLIRSVSTCVIIREGLRNERIETYLFIELINYGFWQWISRKINCARNIENQDLPIYLIGNHNISESELGTKNILFEGGDWHI